MKLLLFTQAHGGSDPIKKKRGKKNSARRFEARVLASEQQLRCAPMLP
jgi:hypothetical protein